MDENFLKSSLDLKKAREERSKAVSCDDLFKVVKKKIQTTMIGSLSTIEEYFGFLWNHGFSELSEEQKHIKDIYEEARAKILDRGNTQIRDLELEFTNYEIVRKKHHIKLPINNKGEKNEG